MDSRVADSSGWISRSYDGVDMMSKWLITWNAGLGDKSEVIEAETHDEALENAYEAWKDDAEANASYEANPYSAALAEKHGLE
jgi:hypothetical protein